MAQPLEANKEGGHTSLKANKEGGHASPQANKEGGHTSAQPQAYQDMSPTFKYQGMSRILKALLPGHSTKKTLSEKKILGIDPGLGTTGWGFVHETSDGMQMRVMDYGVIRTIPHSPLSLRLISLYQDLVQLIQKLRPTEIAMEEIFFVKRISTAALVGQARGVILLACAQSLIPIFEYNPRSIKIALTGSGSADKGQMVRMTQRILSLKDPPRPDDIADALAIALCHLQTKKEWIPVA